VLAAATGTVIYSNSLKDYGETIIIKHHMAGEGKGAVKVWLSARRYVL
jgi:septal ring factor EnvC (AmiA/AmiB activator)